MDRLTEDKSSKEKEVFNLYITISLAFLGIITSLLIPTLIALNLEYYDLSTLPVEKLTHLNNHIKFGLLSFVLFLIVFILSTSFHLILSISKKRFSTKRRNALLIGCTVVTFMSLIWLVLSINNLLLLVGIQVESLYFIFILGVLIVLMLFVVVVFIFSEN